MPGKKLKESESGRCDTDITHRVLTGLEKHVCQQLTLSVCKTWLLFKLSRTGSSFTDDLTFKQTQIEEFTAWHILLYLIAFVLKNSNYDEPTEFFWLNTKYVNINSQI